MIFELTVISAILLTLGTLVGLCSAFLIPKAIAEADFERFKRAGLGVLFQECTVAHVVIGDWHFTLVFVLIVSLVTAVGFQLGKYRYFSAN